MFNNRWARGGLILVAIYFLFFHVFDATALARVGGGGTSGSRGSRPATPVTPSAPSRSYSTPSPGQPSQPAGSPFLRGLAGGLVGGMIGSMLFRGMGFAGPGGGWGGPGLFDILLIGALLYGIYWFVVKRRRTPAAAPSYYQTTSQTAGPAYQSAYGATYDAPHEAVDEASKGLGHIHQMDPSFDEARFRDQCMDAFFQIQGAWANRNMAGARNQLTDEMFGILQGDVDKLRVERKINKLDNIAVRSVEVLEAWQESGQDFITLRFYANLLDYTVEESTGQVLSGSKEDPVKFEEYWTFTRPVGPNPWRLSAISQA